MMSYAEVRCLMKGKRFRAKCIRLRLWIEDIFLDLPPRFRIWERFYDPARK